MSRDWNALGVTQRFWRQHLGLGMRVADATAGNGHDTLLLRELVGESGEKIECLTVIGQVEGHYLLGERERPPAMSISFRNWWPPRNPGRCAGYW